MEAHAAGAGMSTRLAEAIGSYAQCKLDDTWCEAVHRDVSAISKRSAFSRLPHRAASLRLQQNIELASGLSDAEFKELAIMFSKWRAIGQRSATKARKLIPKRNGKNGAIVGKVYRIGFESQTDWSAAIGDILRHQAHPLVRLRRAAKLKVDFLNAVIQTGTVFSLPQPSTILPAIGDGAGTLDHSQRASFFQAVDVALRRKKLVNTATILDMKLMRMPALCQRFMIRAGGHPDAGEHHIFHDGGPELVDLLDLQEWRVLREGLKIWSADPSSFECCIQASSGTLVSQISWDTRHSDAPAIVLVEALVARGWKYCNQRGPHGLEGERVFYFRDAIAAKPYLRCLLHLEDILSDTFPASLVSFAQAQLVDKRASIALSSGRLCKKGDFCAMTFQPRGSGILIFRTCVFRRFEIIG